MLHIALRTGKKTSLLFSLLILASCTLLTKNALDDRYGTEDSRHRSSALNAANRNIDYHAEIQPLLEKRCVVCHGCYDAPCQLKLSSYQGLERGASKDKVYNGTRLLPANLTRLFIDAESTEQWRDKGFYPVLNERGQNADANTNASVLFRMLQLKQRHPLPDKSILPDSFDLSLNRDQQCPKIEEMDRFEERFPLWGMPYALPGIAPQELALLNDWLTQGANVASPPPLSESLQQQVFDWERFLNQTDNKSRLMSRYLYEHLYVQDLYFDDGISHKNHGRIFFKLVRSSTPDGQAINIIATRRPYDDPEVAPFYYRLQRTESAVLSKTHMPYALNEKRMEHYRELFIKPTFNVDRLPSYAPEQASNPFVTFQALPVKSRYQFLLDDAQNIVMGFIKGPVCRGQIALNVINDQFWVLFVSPDAINSTYGSEFLASESKNLRLPAEAENTTLPLTNWVRYARLQKNYFQAKKQFLIEQNAQAQIIDLDLIWDGGQKNTNATLTVFRHFDSASVVKGLVGNTPKTAWLLDYPLLERIHYLLVAGYDVYGNVSHQLLTRLYMDFLRMEAEINFLMLLPVAQRSKEHQFWYRDVDLHVQNYLFGSLDQFDTHSLIAYKSKNPKQELFEMVRQRRNTALRPDYQLATSGNALLLRKLNDATGKSLAWLPPLSYLLVEQEGSIEVYSLILNSAHSNISTLFLENKTRLPEEDSLTVVPGIVGAYPNTFYRLTAEKLPDFIRLVTTMNSENDYQHVMDQYGVRRTDVDFWHYSDLVHQYFRDKDPLDYGLLDYNRLENR